MSFFRLRYSSSYRYSPPSQPPSPSLPPPLKKKKSALTGYITHIFATTSEERDRLFNILQYLHAVNYVIVILC